MKPMKRRPSGAKTIAVAIAAAVALFTAAELGVRVFHPLDALVYRDSENPALAFELKPGASGLKNGVSVSINADGLRDESVASPRPENERRVVVVGGHETFGVGVEADQTFVRELADRLADGSQGRVRTVNVSMYSYQLSQKVELACQKLRGLEPELAVLQMSAGESGRTKPALLDFPSFKNWIRERSMLIRWASESLYLRKPARGPSRPLDAEGVRKDLARFKECADAAGAKAAILLLPDVSAHAPASEYAQLVESAAKADGMPFLDGSSALSAVPAESRQAFPDTPFLSPASQRAVSEAVGRWLKPLLRRRPVKPFPRRPSA
jgi:hypothetical protein